MLIKSILLALLLPLTSMAKAPDVQAISTTVNKIISEIKKEKSFNDKFKYIKVAKDILKKEVSQIKDSEYDQNISVIFQFNFMIANFSDLEESFPKSECSFQRKRFIKNFSDYKTYKIHNSIKPLADQSLRVFDAICGN